MQHLIKFPTYLGSEHSAHTCCGGHELSGAFFPNITNSLRTIGVSRAGFFSESETRKPSSVIDYWISDYNGIARLINQKGRTLTYYFKSCHRCVELVLGYTKILTIVHDVQRIDSQPHRHFVAVRNVYTCFVYTVSMILLTPNSPIRIRFGVVFFTGIKNFPIGSTFPIPNSFGVCFYLWNIDK